MREYPQIYRFGLIFRMETRLGYRSLDTILDVIFRPPSWRTSQLYFLTNMEDCQSKLTSMRRIDADEIDLPYVGMKLDSHTTDIEFAVFYEPTGIYHPDE